MRILRLTREPGDKRTGAFTSGIVSMVGARTIALLFTGWQHAGEIIAEVLKTAGPAGCWLRDLLMPWALNISPTRRLRVGCIATTSSGTKGLVVTAEGDAYKDGPTIMLRQIADETYGRMSSFNRPLRLRRPTRRYQGHATGGY